ncbi:MAG TPA: NYN domain-containing protein [Ktedonobacteraceae bacterium]|nr:NYN domain-containing protein [Ktedonobacteraceae bacterium]
MLECPNCRREFQPGTHFCGTCGKPLLGIVSSVVTSDHGDREPLAGGQEEQASLEQESPEATLVLKKPAGFPWRPQPTKSSDNEPSRTAGRASNEVEEKASAQSGAIRRLHGAVLPVMPVTPVLPTQSAVPAFQAASGLSGAPVTPAVSDLPGIPTSAVAANRTTKGASEHAPFPIPARPSRTSGASVADQLSTEMAEDVNTFALLARRQAAEEPGNRTILGRSAEIGEALAEYPALNAAVQEKGLDLLDASPDVPAAGVPVASSLDKTLIFPDFLADMTDLESALSALPEAATFAPELGASVEAVFPVPTAGTAPTLPASMLSNAQEQIPSPSVEAENEALQLPTGSDAQLQEAEDEEDESLIPTLPRSSVQEASAHPTGAVLAEDEASMALPAGTTDGPVVEDEIDPVACYAPFFKPSEVPSHLLRPDDPYLHLKVELANQRVEITAAMDELLPLVYQNHREENQALFATILAHRPPLDDEAWGHAAFVLGAYGNYMYRHPLRLKKKLEIWSAQLWAVYYERSYRRKYLAQRCQQLIHFFQGCAENATFLAIALHDLETLYFYLEPGSLRKLQQMLQSLPNPPAELLQRIEAQLVIAEQEKAERMAKQLALIQAKTPAQSAPGKQAGPQSAGKAAVQSAQPKTAKAAGQSGVKPAGPPAGRQGFHPVPAKAAGQASIQEVHRWPGFWNEEQRHRFFESLRTDHLETIHQLLLQTRKQILAAARTGLLQSTVLGYQRPRRSVPLRLEMRQGSEYELFMEAFRLLSSPKLKHQQDALRMFERNMRENPQQEYAPVAREWVLYARALVLGSTRAAPDWERNFRRDEASWEEIWNLAYYHYRTGDLAEAIRVLTPGLNELDAPVVHLRLALICALTLVESGTADPAAQQLARELLLHHLERWPDPLSGLIWLIISYDVAGTPRPLEQSRRLSVVQELLENPVNLPETNLDLNEAQISVLEDTLVNKTHCEEVWFLWLNDYAARHPHNFPVWTRLAATSERMERLARAETALQHIAGFYYDLDYVYAREGEEEMQAAAELRGHVEKLFEFYRRHEMQRQAWDSFESCYPTLNHLGFWDEQKAANHRLLTLVAPFLMEWRRRQAHQRLLDDRDARARSEIRRSTVSNNPTRPLEYFKAGQRVGIFVDYENIARLIPGESDMEGVWQTLASYAAQFGDVVCRWASASPRNLSNLTAVRAGLEAAQFRIRYPRRELQFSASQKDLADYALLECLHTASLNDHLDVYLVVSGDRDYYERICTLLESGHVVRILASDENLSSSYRELEQQRQRQHTEAGDEETDFFIDNLDEVLRSLPPASH